MTSPAGNTEPTAEQLRAAHELHECRRDRYVGDDYEFCVVHDYRWPCDIAVTTARAIAAAVAAERDKYLRVADELDGLRREAEEWQTRATRQHHTYDVYWNRGRALAYTSGARRIREVTE